MYGSLSGMVEDRSAPWHAALTWTCKILLCTYLFPCLFIFNAPGHRLSICLPTHATFLWNLKRIHVIQISLRGVFCKHMTNAFIDRLVVWLQDTADIKYALHAEKNDLISISKHFICMQMFTSTTIFLCWLSYLFSISVSLSLHVQYFRSSVGCNRGVMLLFKTIQSYYIKVTPDLVQAKLVYITLRYYLVS